MMKNIFHWGILIIVLIFLSGNTSFAQCTPDTWTQKTDIGGSGRSEAAAFSIGGKGYIGTGYDGGSRLDDFWEYDPGSNAWTQKATFGGGVRDFTVGFAIGTKGYIGTGYFPTTTEFWEYDSGNNTWTKLSNFGGPPRSSAAGFAVGGKGYIGTGWDMGTFHNDFWEFDPGTNAWTQKSNFPGVNRVYAVGLAIGNKGYLGVGGENFSVYKKDFWEYDPATNNWTQKADYGGVAREAPVGFSINNKGYVGLGHIGIFPNSSTLQDFWEYCPATDTWKQVANFGGGARTLSSAFVIGNKGYVGGGNMNGSSGPWVKDFWEYCPDTIPCIICTPPTVKASADITACPGDSMPLSVTGAKTYNWFPSKGLSATTGASVKAAPDTTTTYYVTGTDSVGCSSTDTVLMTVHIPPAVLGSGNDTICAGETVELTSSGALTYTWSPAVSLSPSFGDTVAASPVLTTTYSVIGTDVNGCKDTAFVKIVVHTAPVANAGSSVTIFQDSSTMLTASGGGTYSWYPSTGLSCDTCKTTIAAPLVTTTYTVLVTDSNGCADTALVTVTVEMNCTEIFVPTAFSPNGDGKNDTLYVRGNCLKTFIFSVRNRWGEKVFETQDLNQGWDGKYRNTDQEPSVYVYYLDAEPLKGDHIFRKGNITLVR